MFKDDAQADEAIAIGGEISRRTVNRGMAWSVPVIVGAFAAPAATASPIPPAVTFGGGSGVRGGTASARYVTFTLKFKSDRPTTVTLVSLSPDDAWRPLAGETWPNRILSLGAGDNTLTFILNRTGNTKATYDFAYSVTGTKELGHALVALS